MDVSGFFHSELARTAAVSAVMAIAGWGGSTLLTASDNSLVLQTHTGQIQHIFESQKETKDALEKVSTAIIRIDGKIDVINQKIDDDRTARMHR